MRKALVAWISLACVVLWVSACAGADTEPSAPRTTPQLSGEPIVFGVQMDSHGPASSYSPIAVKTIKYAVDEINESGGILGRPVKVITEEDESDPTKAPSVTRKLLDQGAHVIFETTSSAAIGQTKPVVQQAEIPTFAPIALTPALVTPPDNDYMYVLANPIADWSKVYCGAFQALGAKKLALLSDTTVTIQGLNKTLVPELEKCVDIVANEAAPVDSADLNAQVAKVKSANPDAVLVVSVGGTFEVLAHNTLAVQMPKTQRFSSAAIGNQPQTWELAQPGSLKGLVFMGSIDNANERTQKLEAFMQERDGKDHVITAFDSQSYDAVQMARRAITKAESTEGPAINEALQDGEEFPSSFGGPDFTLSFGEDKHLGTNGLCGLVLTEFGANNKPKGAWETYQPEC